MAQPSPSYTVALRLQVPRSQASVAQLVDTAAFPRGHVPRGGGGGPPKPQP